MTLESWLMTHESQPLHYQATHTNELELMLYVTLDTN